MEASAVEADYQPRGSIVIALHDDESAGLTCLQALQAWRGRGWELVVVAGSSRDRSMDWCRPLADRMLATRPGLASQFNVGAMKAQGDVLVFLLPELRLPATFEFDMAAFEASDRAWGRFDLGRVIGANPLWRVLVLPFNALTRKTGWVFFCQAPFFRRGFFERIGGFPAIKRYPDLALSRQAGRLSIPFRLLSRVDVHPCGMFSGLPGKPPGR